MGVRFAIEKSGDCVGLIGGTFYPIFLNMQFVLFYLEDHSVHLQVVSTYSSPVSSSARSTSLPSTS